MPKDDFDKLISSDPFMCDLKEKMEVVKDQFAALTAEAVKWIRENIPEDLKLENTSDETAFIVHSLCTGFYQDMCVRTMDVLDKNWQSNAKERIADIVQSLAQQIEQASEEDSWPTSTTFH